ncbi:hypothetical protein [Pseudomonas aeruginosa]|uniref:hypothetical protein n=1 Tax=Pseudomonas aeruginosa TaxID=287 RepID=UPI003FD41FE6
MRRLAFIAVISALLRVAEVDAANPTDLHHLVCMSVIETLLQQEHVTEPQLQAAAQEAGDALRGRLERFHSVLALIGPQIQPGEPLSAAHLATFSVSLVDLLSSLQAVESDDLPRRLDFLQVLYVARAQIGSLRPAREQQGNYLSLDIVELAESIDRDMQVLAVPGLNDARRRWDYILPQILHYKTRSMAPLNVAVQIQRITAALASNGYEQRGMR